VWTKLRYLVLSPALAPLFYYCLAIFSSWDYLRRMKKFTSIEPHLTPPVTILKPVCGVDRGVYENFASMCDLLVMNGPQSGAGLVGKLDAIGVPTDSSASMLLMKPETMRVTFEEFSPTHDFFDYGSKRMCKNPRVLTYDWIKTGGRLREGVGAALFMVART